MSGYSFQHACYASLIKPIENVKKCRYYCVNCGEEIQNTNHPEICASLLLEGKFFHRHCLQWDTEWIKRNSSQK